MNQFVKSIVALGITSALTLSAVQAATYKVIDKGDVSSLKFTYSQQENNSGDMAISGTGTYNFPVQLQYLDEDDFEDIRFLADRDHEAVFELNDLEDFDALKARTPTANDLAWVVRFLASNANNILYQEVGDVYAMINTGTSTEEVVVFDQNIPGTDNLSRSTQDFINGITNDGWIYGNASAPYLPSDFTETDGDEVTHWLREFSSRAYVSVDNGVSIKEIVPPESIYGGMSAVLDMNDNRIAVGYASVQLGQSAAEFVVDETGGCADPSTLERMSFDACVQGIDADDYHINAFKWTLDENGNVIDSEDLGQLITPHVDDERVFASYAQAINNAGVIVGFADGWDDETETEPSEGEAQNFSYAVIYKNGEVIDFTGDHSVSVNSRAYDINDKGFAVGHITKSVNGDLRTKFYYVDTNKEEMSLVTPTDFFTGSSSTARAINENGFIVGEGEVETHNDSGSNPRRRHGFLYEIESDTFTNLNSFLPCDSAYKVIEARDINDENEISATAIVKAPRRDAKGELMVDENGDQIEEDVLRAVKLVPIPGGEQENCSVVVEQIERKGAGFGFMSVFFLLAMAIRRKLV